MSAVAPAALVYFEWLFHATKESFLSVLSLPGQLAVLACAVAPAALSCLSAVALLAIGASFARAGVARLLHRAAVLLVAATFATLVMLLADTFTQTVFATGIRNRGRAGGVVYLAGLALLVVLLARWVASRTTRRSEVDDRHAMRAVWAIGSVAVAVVVAASLGRGASHGIRPGAAVRLPNIVMVGSDGVDADRMSLYGYSRDTTPFLSSLASQALVADFAFPNAATTGGSISSLLTGRLPSTTGVLYPPNILRGEDSYRHLPGLLKGHGYRTLQVSIRHYADAYDLNFRRAFDESNGRVSRDAANTLLSRLAGDDAAYLLGAIRDRAEDRLLHLAGVRAMRDVYAELTRAPVGEFGDEEMLARLAEFMTEANQPFFVHVHLMGTHGPVFEPRSREFRGAKLQSHDWQLDHYDDTLRDFDDHIRGIFGTLEKRGILERTIVVVWSDHGTLWRTIPTPLLMRFPGGRASGRISRNVQVVDVAPTILDFMGSAVPEWMDGRSLLGGVDECRPILSFAQDWNLQQRFGGFWFAPGVGRLGSAGFVHVIECDAIHSFDVRGGVGVTVPLRRQMRPVDRGCGCTASRASAGSLLVGHLGQSGFLMDPAVARDLPLREGITQGEAARHLVEALHGAGFVPPAPSRQRFDDVPLDWPEARWVEQAAADGVVTGCQPRLFCPEKPVDRVTLAAAFGRASRWPGGEATVMKDLELVKWAAVWIDRVVAEGVMSACGPGRFCPSRWVTREELARVMGRVRPSTGSEKRPAVAGPARRHDLDRRPRAAGSPRPSPCTG